jgi:hypothetical protein
MEQDKPSIPSAKWPRNAWVLTLLAVWILFIFGTSCTVILPEEFFRLIASFTGANRQSMERFAIFWGVSWFAIVKGWHFTEFAILTTLVVYSLKKLFGRVTRGTILASMLLCVAFAASDEWHQTFVPNRFGTVQDVMIDSLGICSAGAIMLLRLRKSSLPVSSGSAVLNAPPVRSE